MKYRSSFLALIFSLFLLAGSQACRSGGTSVAATGVPAPKPAATIATAVTTAATNGKALQTAVFAGGCFWGVEAVYEHTKGVTDSRSGYAGGTAKTAKYDIVSGGSTGHAESVQVTFDPSQVSYEQLLHIFFSVVHDPTQLNRQGPDSGTQYRSAIFYTSEDQKRAAENYIGELSKGKTFSKPIVTQVVQLDKFYDAEDYHQDYLEHHPDEPYIVVNDQPKVDDLKKKFPDLYVTK
ncbi:MAG TPA: peptide-methionine (S)-S-oxide reductase MsrA [Pyrinomonadaceae bacterium]|jgi:peptide-methionine (S)-S-oxide reductase|nr:peptide-methionine (S)-S-oxide reductase MsrA [Pyrinomonadaceae bacterium]